MKVEEKGQRVLDTKGDYSMSWTVADVDAVLMWYNHPQQNKLSKELKLKAWDAIRDRGKLPPTYERWADDDDQELLAASSTNITVDLDSAQAIRMMTKEELEAALAAKESIDNTITLGAIAVSDGAVGKVSLVIN